MNEHDQTRTVRPTVTLAHQGVMTKREIKSLVFHVMGFVLGVVLVAVGTLAGYPLTTLLGGVGVLLGMLAVRPTRKDC